MHSASPDIEFAAQLREALNFNAKVQSINLQSFMSEVASNISKLQREVQKLNVEITKKADAESTTKNINDIDSRTSGNSQLISGMQNTLQDMKNDMSVNFRKILSESKRYTELLLNDFRQEMNDQNEKTVLKARASGANLDVLSGAASPGAVSMNNVPVISPPSETEADAPQTTPLKGPERVEHVDEDSQIRVPSPEKEPIGSQTSFPTSPEKGSRPPSRQPGSSEIPPEIMQRLDTIDYHMMENDHELQRIGDQIQEVESLKKLLQEQNAKFDDQSIKLNEELENLKASQAKYSAIASAQLSVQPSLSSIKEADISLGEEEENGEKSEEKPKSAPKIVNTPPTEEEKTEEDGADTAELTQKLAQQQAQMMQMIKNAKSDQIDSTELMAQIMDAVRFEIEINARQNNEKIAANLRKAVDQLSTDISDRAAKTKETIKAYDEKLLALQKKASEDLNKFTSTSNAAQSELRDRADQLQKTVDALNEKVKSMSATGNLGPKINTIPIKDGKADLTPILNQLGNVVQAITELDTRLDLCEKATADVSMETIKAMRALLNEHDSRINGFDSNIVGIEMKIGALGDRVSELKGLDHSADQERKFNEIRELIANLEDSTKSLREGLTKVIQDNATDRVTTMMTKSKLDDHTKGLDEAQTTIAQLKDESAGLSSRLKKVISLIQSINTELSEKLSQTSNMVANHTEEIERLKNMLSNTERNLTAAISAQNEKITARNNEMTRPASSKSSRSPSPPVHVPSVPTELRIEMSGKPNTDDEDEPPPPTTPVAQTEDTATSPHMELPNMQNWVERPLEKSQLPKLKQPKPGDKRTSARSLLGTVDQKKFEESTQKVMGIENSMSSVKSALETLHKQTKSLTDNKADKDAVQSLYEQLKSALAEMNNRLGSFRRLLGTKVDASDLNNLRKELLVTYQAQGETAAGTENIRCLLCGQIRKGVTGTTEQKIESQIQTQVADKVQQMKNDVEIVPAGPLFSSSVGGNGEDGTPVYIYTQSGEMYKGRSMEKQRIVPAEGPILPEDNPLPNL